MGNSNSGSARADDDGSGTGAPAPGRVVLHPPDTRPPPLVSPNPLTYIVVGAGNRGSIYGMYGGEQPGLARVVGVAEPQPGRRALFAETHDIDPEHVYEDWREIAALDGRIADAVVITTLDNAHAEPAIAFAGLGYHIFLEKPMAVTEEDCRAIAAAVAAAGVQLAVGHVLRYSPYFRALQDLLDAGAIGDLVSIQHHEPVGYYHAAHSYVRGNWRREDETTFMLMAKCCHDVDLIRSWMGEECAFVSSFGTQRHFSAKHKPEGAGDRCLECGVEETCPYSAKKIYLDKAERGYTGWPLKVLVDGVPDIENVTAALESGPYGRCVYGCDNTVVDNQVVAMQFASGRTATLTMVAFTEEICVRKTRLFGSMGEIVCDGDAIVVYDFRTKMRKRVMPCLETPTRMIGHEGGDFHIMDSFVKTILVERGDLDEEALETIRPLCSPEEVLEAHLIVFAAEHARRTNAVVDVAAFVAAAGKDDE